MKIESFLGIHNQSPARSIPNNALVDAVNVDLDNAGIVTRRNGFALAKAIAGVTSGYSTLDQTAYVVASGYMYRILSNLTTINLGATTATEFDSFEHILFTNDGLRIESDTVTNLKLPSPELPPTLTLVDGDLEPGRYSATYCYRSATGLEGGSSPIATIELTTTGGILVSPGTLPAGYTAEIYLTEANGDVFFDNSGFPIGKENLLADPFPDAVEFIAYHNTRLYVSKSLSNGSSVIWYSAPYQHHLYDNVNRFIVVPGQVLAMASTDQGLLIGTNASIFVYVDGVLATLARYGVIPGRPFTKTAEGPVFIHSKRGECVAMPFANLTSKKVSLAPGLQCSTALVEQSGTRRFVVVTDGGGMPFNRRS